MANSPEEMEHKLLDKVAMVLAGEPEANEEALLRAYKNPEFSAFTKRVVKVGSLG